MNKKIIFLVLSTLFAVSAWAQKLSIGYLYPAGGEMGQTVEIEAGGLNINKAAKVLFNHPGISGVVFPVKESAAEKKPTVRKATVRRTESKNEREQRRRESAKRAAAKRYIGSRPVKKGKGSQKKEQA